MSRVDTATAMDRLPWLSDEPTTTATPWRGDRMIIASVTIFTLLAGGAALWFGARTLEEARPFVVRKAATTVRLPPARPAPVTQAEVNIPPPAVEPLVPAPTPVMEASPQAQAAGEEQGSQSGRRAEWTTATEQPRKLPPQILPKPWPVRVIDGAAGRLVRVGAFRSVHQAKLGWWAIVKVNPALERLPALVVPVRSLRTGRPYYRLQMGTTSEAHSEVLCQRMRMIAQSCVVVGTQGGK